MAEIDPSIQLTRRQQECMALVAKGLTAKRIARKLSISHRTVEQHIAAAIDALGATNRLGAVARFIELQDHEVPAEDQSGLMVRQPASRDEMLLIKDNANALQESEEAAFWWPFLPPLGGSGNAAPREVRLSWIFRLSLFAIMLSCVAILSIFGLIEMAR